VQFRCALLTKAALEAPWVVPCGGAPYGEVRCTSVALLFGSVQQGLEAQSAAANMVDKCMRSLAALR